MSIENVTVAFIILIGLMYLMASRRLLAIVKLHVFIKDGKIITNSGHFPYENKKEITINKDIDKDTLKAIKRGVEYIIP